MATIFCLDIRWMKSVRIRSFFCPYFLEFLSVFSRIPYFLEYGEILRIFSYSVQNWENTDQKNLEYGHFLRSDLIRKLQTNLWINLISLTSFNLTDIKWDLFQTFKTRIRLLHQFNVLSCSTAPIMIMRFHVQTNTCILSRLCTNAPNTSGIIMHDIHESHL